MKITIMGGGGVVGSSAAFRIAQEGLASEIVLVDARENMAKAHALDIEQAVVHRSTTQVRAGKIEETKDSNVVLIAVGVLGLSASQPSRLSQFEDNIAILKDLMKPLLSYSPSALWMMATVPLDPIIYLFHKHFSIPRQKMIGVNRNDTSRFRWAIGKILSVPAPSVEAFVLGEHGETQVPLFSSIRIRGERISLTPEQVEQIRNKGMDFLPQWVKWQPGRTAGWTTAESIGDILKSMVSDDGRIWPCSTPLEGEYGLREVSLGVPLRIGPKGVKEIVEFDLEASERKALEGSASMIREQIKQGKTLLEKAKK